MTEAKGPLAFSKKLILVVEETEMMLRGCLITHLKPSELKVSDSDRFKTLKYTM